MLDIHYIGSKHNCDIAGYNYKSIYERFAECLQIAEYPFLYYCRSTPQKSDNRFNRADSEHIMKMKLSCHFMDKGYYFNGHL